MTTSVKPNPAKSKSPSLITKPPIAANHAHIHQFSVNQAGYQEEKAERSRQTVGAAWALTLGNVITRCWFMNYRLNTECVCSSCLCRIISHSRPGSVSGLPSTIS